MRAADRAISLQTLYRGGKRGGGAVGWDALCCVGGGGLKASGRFTLRPQTVPLRMVVVVSKDGGAVCHEGGKDNQKKRSQKGGPNKRNPRNQNATNEPKKCIF